VCLEQALPCGWTGSAHGNDSSHGRGSAYGNDNTHGRGTRHTTKRGCTTKASAHGKGGLARQRYAAHGKEMEARQCLCRAVLATLTAKTTSHGNAFAVRIEPFAVQLACTATSGSPVVSSIP
jgi:hypothetical protein